VGKNWQGVWVEMIFACARLVVPAVHKHMNKRRRVMPR
jgi:hypothetical protein